MEKYFLAVDIGASSGRHILGCVRDGRMELEEIYRFPNGMKSVDGQLCWDVEELFSHIKAGMKRCKEIGKIPVSMGIDTWAVDYVLLDEQDRVVGNTVGYRDSRTKGMDNLVYQELPLEELYQRTGIQKQIFNTIYQFMAVKKQHPEYLETAKTMLMIPDYFHYRLTGVKKQEYTNATTTQLVNPMTNTWDYELIERLGYPKAWFGPLSMPGTTVGGLTPEVEAEVGFSCQVVLPATHDTGSAVLAVPSNEWDVLYISSGTWSLMGTERMEADCSLESMKRNFTNEGGYEYRFRYLKNIMGLWMIQSVKKELAAAGQDYSFGEICDMASKETISSLVDCNDDCFLAPESMIQAVKDFCEKEGQQVPKTPAQLGAVIYNSLAKCYGETIEELEQVTGKHYGQVHIVGGGANADYLNRLTAKYTGRPVYAGPTEATAIGNLTAQMIEAGEYGSLAEARRGIFESFEIKRY
ncbi:MAG: rhamnulokinase [Hungatella sp.]|nr:rhamnulokinase [Hungatella sp.]